MFCRCGDLLMMFPDCCCIVVFGVSCMAEWSPRWERRSWLLCFTLVCGVCTVCSGVFCHWWAIFCEYCYDRALLPSIICLGRLRIASKYIFNLWQLRQGVDSLAQWLEHWIFNRENRVRIPRSTGNFFSYVSFLCYDYHVVRWGLVRDWTLYAENGFTSS